MELGSKTLILIFYPAIKCNYEKSYDVSIKLNWIKICRNKNWKYY